jgi:hypothetical protein
MLFIELCVWAGGVAQVIEHLPQENGRVTLSSNSTTINFFYVSENL